MQRRSQEERGSSGSWREENGDRNETKRCDFENLDEMERRNEIEKERGVWDLIAVGQMDRSERKARWKLER